MISEELSISKIMEEYSHKDPKEIEEEIKNFYLDKDIVKQLESDYKLNQMQQHSKEGGSGVRWRRS